MRSDFKANAIFDEFWFQVKSSLSSILAALSSESEYFF